MSKGFIKNLIPISIIIAGLLIAGALIYLNQGKTEKAEGQVLIPQQAAQIAIDYINQNILQQGTTASLLSVAEENGVYKFRLKIGENEYDSYVTKDGKILFPESYDLAAAIQKEEEGETEGITKQDTPDVKVFVMSYCPYGLQAQKMFLPVYDLLKDKAEMGIYFVDYIMHEKQEIDENLRQYCIQEEEKEKFSSYLSCFVKDGDFEKCLSETNIDRTELVTCVSEADQEYDITLQYNDKSTWLNERFPKFDVHSDLNEKYGVRGSPAVVINDQVVNISPRSPEKFKEVICQAFTSQPEECSQTLSNDIPSPGLGGGTGSSNEGSCG